MSDRVSATVRKPVKAAIKKLMKRWDESESGTVSRLIERGLEVENEAEKEKASA